MNPKEFKSLANNLYDFLQWMETEKGIDIPELIAEYNDNVGPKDWASTHIAKDEWEHKIEGY